MNTAGSGGAAGRELAQLRGKPRLTRSEAHRLLARWQVRGELSELESERDQNWLVLIDGTPRHVLKIANYGDTPELIEFQQLMMRRLVAAGLPCPETNHTADDRAWIRVDRHVAWLIGFRPGRRLAEEPSPSPAAFTDLGEVLGRAAIALRGFDHPAAHDRHLQWDVRHAEEVIGAYARHIGDASRRELVDRALADFRRDVAPVLEELPHSVIHNDANDHNVLISGSRVSGLLDFGDAVHSVTVNDLAIACAYSMLDRDEPADVAERIINGYRGFRAMSGSEQQVLPVLIRTRLAMSVVISGYQQTVHPENSYLRVSEAPAWRLLERLEREQS